MKIRFLGATGTVTGSKYLVTCGSRKILVDCGLFQGYKQLRLRNRAALAVDPREIDAVVLTHAHLDHSGYLPLLIKNGFKGKVYCSAATRDLCGILLPDSGYLQEEEARYANKRGYSKHAPALPLYTEEDARNALRQLSPIAFEHDADLGAGLTLRLIPNGHILGSACALLSDTHMRLLFSGDLGRPHDPTMYAPRPIQHTDYLVIESTYGNRRHDQSDPQEELAEVINRTVARSGMVLIPAFAVGRTQTLLHYLRLLKDAGTIPDIPVFLNSPLATSATNIFCDNADIHRLTPQECEAISGMVKYVNSVEESKALNRRKGPMIIISASGMATGGRVLHHLKAFAPDARNTILFSGFQAGGTRGAAMLDGAESVKIHGEYIPVHAEVAALDNLSAHADYVEIIDWLRHFDAPPRTTFITHGEPAAADGLRQHIEEQLGWQVVLPDYLETVALE
ncbi:MAG: MBL fold metallo-hydrolase [Gammaproteobacteria bacterium]|nr:MBL fold metallo-hydrolase [Gammaproteobacteria bacterium]